MPRQNDGSYQQPAATAAVSAATISSSAFNTLITDIGTELTNSVDRAGRSAMTAALPMGSQKNTEAMSTTAIFLILSFLGLAVIGIVISKKAS